MSMQRCIASCFSERERNLLFVLEQYSLQIANLSPSACSNDARSTCQEVEICHSSVLAQAPNAHGEGEAGWQTCYDCRMGNDLLRWQGVGDAATSDSTDLAKRRLQQSLLSTDHRQLSLRWLFGRSMINETFCNKFISLSASHRHPKN